VFEDNSVGLDGAKLERSGLSPDCHEKSRRCAILKEIRMKSCEMKEQKEMGNDATT
jgi:hypothetical protein